MTYTTTPKSYLCDTCGKFFFEKWNLSLHIRSVHEKIKKRFQCTLCSKTYCRKDILTKHVNNLHDGQ